MATFSDMIHADKPVLVDFFAEWCGPCKLMKPVLEEVKKKLGDEVIIIKVDVDKNPHAASKYNVQGVPTLALFRNGNMLWRQAGAMPAAQLLQVIGQYGRR